MKIESSSETSMGITIRVASPVKRYIDEFIKLNCAPTLLDLKLFPNAKEITESMAAFVAVRKALGNKRFGESDIVMMDVGSGHCPRTAGLFACMTNWQCIAIDPELRDDRLKYNRIKRLSLFRGKVQHLPVVKADLVVVAAVHAHVGLDKILKRIQAKRILMIAMPCCQPLELEWTEPDYEYEDHSCWSPHRTVKVYDLEMPQCLQSQT